MKKSRYKIDLEEENEYFEIPRAMAYEVMQVILAQAKRMLKIDRDIIIITNEKYWQSQFPEVGRKMGDSFARVEQSDAYIYINFDTVRTLKRLIQSIWHECIHIKWPKWREAKVRRKVKEILK